MAQSPKERARAARNSRLKAQFNITADEWDAILVFQNGVCALCEEALVKWGKNKGKPKPLHTDHDHHTGLTRGILCVGCNRKMPTWMTVEWLEGALRYMKNPPVTLALGEERIGRKGRVTNKRPVKRKAKRAPRKKK